MSFTETTAIGQSMAHRLLATGFLTTVTVQPQENSLWLDLQPKRGVAISPRIIRFCLNFLGERLPTRKSDIFPWAASFIEFADGDCRIWVGCEWYHDNDVISELIVLALKLSQRLPISSSTYRIDDVLRIYRTKEEVLSFYEGLVARVIEARDDLFTSECELQLRHLWLCCPKHRYLFAQRLLLNGWLHHIFEMQELPERSHDPFLESTPSQDEMQQRILSLLARKLTPQAWLEDYFAYRQQFELGRWELPTRSCQFKHFVAFNCCWFHTSLMLISSLYGNWMEHFDSLYHISSMVDTQGYTPGFLSATGMALFIQLAKLDTSTITFLGGFRTIPSIDISTYERRAEPEEEQQ